MSIVQAETIPQGQTASSSSDDVEGDNQFGPAPSSIMGASYSRPADRVEPDHPHYVLRALTLASPILLVLLALAVLLGWHLGNETLMTVLPGHVRMKPNAALGFLFAGLGLAALVQRSGRMPRIAQGFGVLTFACGALTLAEYVFHLNLHIDQALFLDSVQHIYPGRMAHITAVNFCLAGLSLLLLGGRPRAALVGQWCALAIAVDSFAAFVSYLYGAHLLYGSVDYPSMALHTGVGFLVLGAGLIVARPEVGFARVFSAPQLGGWLCRRLLPAVLLLPLIPGWVALHPAVLFDRPRLTTSLFAVAFAALGSVALWALAIYLNREELHRLELIRAREESALSAQQSERELRLVTDHLPTLLSYIDVHGRFLRVNRTYERWMGLSAAEIVGRSIIELLGHDYWQRTAAARDAVLRGETVTFEIAYPTVYGSRRAEVTYAPDKDETDHVRGIACMVLDIHERHRAELALMQSAELETANRQLQHLAITDQLTGLKNRRAFEDALEIECIAAETNATSLAVLMIDIDNFKLRNDTWGHAAGDDVLRKLGAILAATVDAPNLPARYGGEEFTILMPATDHAHAYLTAERLQRIIAEQHWGEAPVTLSIGISCSTTVGPNANQLVRSADKALYLAKRTGKNRICTETVV